MHIIFLPYSKCKWYQQIYTVDVIFKVQENKISWLFISHMCFEHILV